MRELSGGGEIALIEPRRDLLLPVAPPELKVHGGHVGPRVQRHLAHELVRAGEGVAGGGGGGAVAAVRVRAVATVARAELGVQAQQAGGAVSAALNEFIMH